MECQEFVSLPVFLLIDTVTDANYMGLVSEMYLEAWTQTLLGLSPVEHSSLDLCSKKHETAGMYMNEGRNILQFIFGKA